MGTNYYLYRNPDEAEGKHVGKCSAAGLYCWDCHQTLAGGGDVKKVHMEIKPLPACPKCGKKVALTPWLSPKGNLLKANEFNPVLVQLGLQKPGETPLPTGIAGASSFTWAMPIEEAKGHTLIDEYEQVYTWEDFERKVLAYCPIQFTDSIGVDFS